jgi:hypothetical protein
MTNGSQHIQLDTNIKNNTDKIYRSTKKNTRISGTCSLKKKTDMTVFFAVFYSPTEIVSLYTSEKALRCRTLYSECHL